MAAKQLDAPALELENAELYRKLAHAELAARTGWDRYAGANGARKVTELQLLACNEKNQALMQELAVAQGTLRNIERAMRAVGRADSCEAVDTVLGHIQGCIPGNGAAPAAQTTTPGANA